MAVATTEIVSEILEGASIAWPSPGLWRRSPFVPSALNGYGPQNAWPSDQLPRQRRSADASQKLSGAVSGAQPAMSRSLVMQDHSDGRKNVNCPPTFAEQATGADPFHGATAYYCDWLNNLDNSVHDPAFSSSLSPSLCIRSQRLKTNTDTSMPDYPQTGSLGLADPTDLNFSLPPSFAPGDDSLHLSGPNKVPTNTPTVSATEVCEYDCE